MCSFFVKNERENDKNTKEVRKQIQGYKSVGSDKGIEKFILYYNTEQLP